MAECFGVVGNHLTQQLDFENQSFRVKHGFLVHTLEDEILRSLLDAMNQKANVRLELKSSRKGMLHTADCTPMQIFTSTRSGRRFLCGYLSEKKRFSCYRLDTIKTVTLLDLSEKYDELSSAFARNRKYLWGVSFQSSSSHHLNKLTMKIQVHEPHEQYIVERLKLEGRGGSVTRLEEGIWQYETEVFDCNEMLPWLRTFIGRILSLECTDKSVEKRFYQDLKTMYRMYQIEN